MIKINKALVAGLALTAALATFTQNAEARKITIGDAIGILGSIGGSSRGSSGGAVDSISNMGKQKHAVMNMNDAQKLLLLGVKNGDIEIVSQMLAQGLDINGVYNDSRYSYSLGRGTTPVLLALRERNEEMIQYLLSQGADPDGFYDLENDRISYIVWAAGGNDFDLVKLLHESGAPINSKTKQRRETYNAVNVMLMDLTSHVSVELLQYLIDEGIDLELKLEGKTPFVYAVERRVGNWEPIEILANGGANLAAKDVNGKNALQYVTAQNDLQYYRFIKDIYDRGQQPSRYNPDN